MQSPIPSSLPGDTAQFVREPDMLAATPMRYHVPMLTANLVPWTPGRLLLAFANFVLTAPRLFASAPQPAIARAPARKDHSV
jgi:hypothetical protein